MSMKIGIRALVKSAGGILGELASKIADIDCVRLCMMRH